MAEKKLPVGIEYFSEIITDGYYYVDKTGLIKDLLEQRGKVNLFTRPRRFGKSLNMNMLKCFFETGCDKSLFDGLEISKETALCGEYMGKFPVISVSLKSVKAETFETAKDMMCLLINREVSRLQQNMASKPLTESQNKLLRSLSDEKMGDAYLMNSLLLLSDLLSQYYSQKVIILIDEYDVPLAKANDYGYYDQMVLLIRNLFEQALKTNDSLYFAVLTGCLRVSKESIFTGLNNLKVRTISDVSFDEYFGFTDAEVLRMLQYYGLESHYDDVRNWYDGYLFGKENIYCPWNVINYCDKLREDPDLLPESYWSNSSENSIVKRFLQKAKKPAQREIERLIAGETIEKTIIQELTYDELESSIENIWSVLYTTGYLTQKSRPQGNCYQLVIPNLEIREIFINHIKEWFQEETHRDRPKLSAFCAAFKDGKPELIEQQLTGYLMSTISIRDTFSQKARKENFYHGVLLGLLSSEEDWILTSNAESGEGYSDILVEIEEEQLGIVIELKYSENSAPESMTEQCEKALHQIREKQYAQKLRSDDMETILAYGIACHKKRCKVMFERL